MKHHLILATVLALSAISCHKAHETEPTWYFQGKLNGVFFKDSTTPAMLPETQAGGIYSTKIVARNGAISLTLSSPLGTGERIIEQSNLFNFASVAISDGNGHIFYAGFGLTHPQGSGKINILEAASYVRGTVECIATLDSTLGLILPPLTLTEGEFKVKQPQ